MIRTRTAFLVVAVSGVALGVGVPWSVARAGAPRTIQYQGRLTDSNGTPLDGTVARLRFRVFTSPSADPSTFKWGELHEYTVCRRGIFTVTLGAGAAKIDASGAETIGPNPFDSTHFDDGLPRYVQVQVNDDAPLSPLSPMTSVPYAITAGGSVPLGTVVAWWPPAPGAPVPSGYEYCDGSEVVSEGPFKGLNKPDLMGTQRFLRGLSMSAIGTFGGASAFPSGGADTADDHAHTTSDHQHTVPSLANHTHAVRGSTVKQQTQLGVLSGVDDFRGFQVTWDHTHQIDLMSEPAGAQGSTLSGSAGAGTTSPSGGHDNRPAFVEMAFIVRVQ